MLAHLGAIWAQLAGHVGPSGGYEGPACACFGAYVRPLQSQDRKMGKPQNTVNCGMFVGSATKRERPTAVPWPRGPVVPGRI